MNKNGDEKSHGKGAGTTGQNTDKKGKKGSKADEISPLRFMNNFRFNLIVKHCYPEFYYK